MIFGYFWLICFTTEHFELFNKFAYCFIVKFVLHFNCKDLLIFWDFYEKVSACCAKNFYFWIMLPLLISFAYFANINYFLIIYKLSLKFLRVGGERSAYRLTTNYWIRIAQNCSWTYFQLFLISKLVKILILK